MSLIFVKSSPSGIEVFDGLTDDGKREIDFYRKKPKDGGWLMSLSPEDVCGFILWFLRNKAIQGPDDPRLDVLWRLQRATLETSGETGLLMMQIPDSPQTEQSDATRSEA